jgi:ABC-type sugar transport system ATPase subunit
MVFQNYALYPHMTVYQNMSFGLRLKHFPKPEIEKRVQEAARILDIKELLDRKPRQLSGGQRQRVAMGRAIVRNPKVFLFDEPLSNLDAALRVATRIEIAKLKESMPATTMIYVTHDQVEAMTLADRIVVLDRGVVAQVGAPLELYTKPENKFVASFIGSPTMNFLAATPRSLDGRDIMLALERDGGPASGALTVRTRNALDGTHSEPAEIGIRPEHIAIADPADERTHLTGAVQLVERLGNLTIVYVETAAGQIVVEGNGAISVNTDETVGLVLDPSRTHVFGRDGKVL